MRSDAAEVFAPVQQSKHEHIPPLFTADSVNFRAYASKDGKISMSYPGWDNNKVVLEDQVFELSCGRQGLEGRILPRRRRGGRIGGAPQQGG